jgi:pSer/pThr/pTyr-binding forkhead associated (FHA) protein
VIPLTYITRTPFNIGRREGNDLVVKVDNSAGVSGQHATITFINGQFYIQDDRSTYGTTVNGKSAPKGMPVPLENGAIIGLGPKVTIEFHVE